MVGSGMNGDEILGGVVYFITFIVFVIIFMDFIL